LTGVFFELANGFWAVLGFPFLVETSLGQDLAKRFDIGVVEDHAFGFELRFQHIVQAANVVALHQGGFFEVLRNQGLHAGGRAPEPRRGGEAGQQRRAPRPPRGKPQLRLVVRNDD
jgi:hypothetical protein